MTASHLFAYCQCLVLIWFLNLFKTHPLNAILLEMIIDNNFMELLFFGKNEYQPQLSSRQGENAQLFIGSNILQNRIGAKQARQVLNWVGLLDNHSYVSGKCQLQWPEKLTTADSQSTESDVGQQTDN